MKKHFPPIDHVHLRLHRKFGRLRVFENAKTETARNLAVRVFHHVCLLHCPKLGEVLPKRVYILNEHCKRQTICCLKGKTTHKEFAIRYPQHLNGHSW